MDKLYRLWLRTTKHHQQNGCNSKGKYIYKEYACSMTALMICHFEDMPLKKHLDFTEGFN